MRAAYLSFALCVLGIFCLAKGSLPPPSCRYYNPCRNGGVCIQVSYLDLRCQCVGHYTGRRCETAITACLSNPCLGGGTCAVGSQNPRHWYCICPPGKTGLRCEKVIHDCSSEPCQNGGSCCENQNGYTCDCKPGFTGKYCETDIDECLSEPCQNGGACVDQVNGYSCSCRVGLEGRHCERKKPGCHSNTCLNGGSCAESSDGMWYCVCPKTHRGIQCEQQVNDCSSHPCQNGGSCCDKGDRYECKCPDGYSGTHCETELIVPSSTSTVISSISTATFTLMPTMTTTIPGCRCQNGGQCHYSIGHTYCSCSFPYTGQYCETHACDLRYFCANGGTCIRNQHNASCICAPHYTGRYCNQPMTPSTTLTSSSSVTRSISPSPSSSSCNCVHGRCVRATCFCGLHYYGPRCEYEHNPCTRTYVCPSSMPCSKISGDQYTCLPQSSSLTPTPTLSSSSTTTASITYDHICDIFSPCRHGQCVKISASPYYRCQCDPGYFGSLCQTPAISTSTVSSFSGTSSWTTTIVSTYSPGVPSNTLRTSTPPLRWTGHPHTTASRTSDYRSSTVLTATTSLPPKSSASNGIILKKRSRRETRKNDEITEIEDRELKRICKLNKRKARKFFSNKQLDKKTWNKLHPGIQAVLIDLVANNDHRRLSGTHAQIKNAVAQNDLSKMSQIMADRSLWKRVPVARYWKRKQMMKKAVKKPWSSLVTSEEDCN